MVEIFAGSGGIEHGPRAPQGCSKCGDVCLPSMRAATPPKDWLDLVDRQALLIASGHWSAATAVYVFLAGLAVTVPLIVLGFCGYLVFGALGAVAGGGAGILGGAGVVGAVLGWARIRRHREQLAGDPPPAEPPDPGSALPRAA